MNRPREASKPPVDHEPSLGSEGLDQNDQVEGTETHTTSSQCSTSVDESTWAAQEMSHLQTLSSLITKLHSELRMIRTSLGERYRPNLEGQSHRLVLERDETLIAWGQSILGLCSAGMKLELVTLQGDKIPLLDTLNIEEVTPFSFLDYSGHQDSDLEGDAKVFGVSPQLMNASMITPHTAQPVSLTEFVTPEEPDLSDYDSSELEVTETPITYSERAQIQHSASSAHTRPTSLPTNEVDDPGVADAPQVSLAQFSLDDLRNQMLNPKGWNQDPVDAEDDHDDSGFQLAIEVVQRIGNPRPFNNQQLREHLIELEAEVDCCQRWSVFDQNVQHAVVTLITSRLRNIQDQIGENTFDQERIAKMFRRLTRFSSDFRPGFVHGLARDKIPEHESWKVDEVHAWRRLEQLLNIQPELPKLSPERTEKLDRLKDLLTREEDLPNFSNELRAAVTDCINSGFSQDSPHLSRLLEHHLSHLSGKRFKKLRLAASSRV